MRFRVSIIFPLSDGKEPLRPSRSASRLRASFSFTCRSRRWFISHSPSWAVGVPSGSSGRVCVWFPLGACVRYEPRPSRHVGDVSSRGCDQGFLSLSFHPEIRNRFNKGTDSTGRAGLGDRLPAEGLRNSSFLSSIALFGLTRVTAAVGTDMRVKTEMI